MNAASAVALLLLAGACTKHPSERECQELEEHVGSLAVERKLGPDAGLAPDDRKVVIRMLAHERLEDPDAKRRVSDCQRTLSYRSYECMLRATSPEGMEACGR
jgi:hypothetical protein